MNNISISPTTSIEGESSIFTDDAAQLRISFELLSPAELSTLLTVDERTLSVWRCQKRGPDFVKLGRAVFYRKRDVVEWINLNTIATDRAV
jgi:Helix-turn-helix domain